jgi:hypothetical protein
LALSISRWGAPRNNIWLSGEASSHPSSGEATVEITNVGKQSHEVGIGRKGVKGEGAEVTTVFAPTPAARFGPP